MQDWNGGPAFKEEVALQEGELRGKDRMKEKNKIK